MMKTIAWTLAALLALLGLTCGGAYLNLGAGNLALGLGIAALKIALVGWYFMRLNDGSAPVRTTAVVAVVALALLFVLSGMDLWTRHAPAASWQVPHQIQPVLAH